MKAVFKSNRLSLAGAVIALSAMIFSRDVLGFGISKYLLILTYIIAFYFLDKRGIVLLLGFTMPLLYGLPNTYISIAAAVFLLIKRRDDFDYRLLLAPLLLSAQELMLSIWYPSIDIASEASFIATLFLLAVLCRIEKEDAAGFLCMFVFGTAFALIVVIASTASALGVEGLLSGSMRLGYDAEAWLSGAESTMKVKFNPNEVGYYSLTAITCSCILFYRTKTNRIFILACSLVCVVAGFMSQSRTWVIMILAIVALQVVLSIGSMRRFGKAVVIVGAVAIAAITFCAVNPEIAESVVSRFENSTMESGGGRTERFDAYNDYFASSGLRMLFGTGAVEYREVSGIADSSHNGIQQLYVCLGIVGAAGFIAMIVYNAACAVNRSNFNLVNTLPIIAVIAFTQSIQIINPWSLMLPLSCGIAALSLGEGEERKYSILEDNK